MVLFLKGFLRESNLICLRYQISTKETRANRMSKKSSESDQSGIKKVSLVCIIDSVQNSGPHYLTGSVCGPFSTIGSVFTSTHCPETQKVTEYLSRHKVGDKFYTYLSQCQTDLIVY